MSARGDDALRAWVRAREGEIVELLLELVRIDSTTGREDELARHCAAWLAARGITALLQPCKGRHNVIGTVGTGSRTLILSGHLDTVPAEAAAWSRDPHDACVSLGRLYGLGASDLKASIAAAYFAQLYLRDHGPAEGRTLSVFTIEEETTGDGTRLFLEWALREGLLRPEQTLAVITEPTGLREVCIANAGSIFVELGVRGRGGHGSRPQLAKNPIEKLVELCAASAELARRWSHEHGDRETPRALLTPTALAAGDPARANVIPEVARALFDMRVPSALYRGDFALLRRELEVWVARFAEPGFELTWRVLNRREGHRIPADHALVASALEILRGDLGLAAELATTTAGNDAVYFGLAGIPAINKVGPGHPECAHKVDESVAVENVLAGAEFFARLALAAAAAP